MSFLYTAILPALIMLIDISYSEEIKKQKETNDNLLMEYYDEQIVDLRDVIRGKNLYIQLLNISSINQSYANILKDIKRELSSYGFVVVDYKLGADYIAKMEFKYRKNGTVPFSQEYFKEIGSNFPKDKNSNIATLAIDIIDIKAIYNKKFIMQGIVKFANSEKIGHVNTISCMLRGLSNNILSGIGTAVVFEIDPAVCMDIDTLQNKNGNR